MVFPVVLINPDSGLATALIADRNRVVDIRLFATLDHRHRPGLPDVSQRQVFARLSREAEPLTRGTLDRTKARRA